MLFADRFSSRVNRDRTVHVPGDFQTIQQALVYFSTRHIKQGATVTIEVVEPITKGVYLKGGDFGQITITGNTEVADDCDTQGGGLLVFEDCVAPQVDLFVDVRCQTDRSDPDDPTMLRYTGVPRGFVYRNAVGRIGPGAGAVNIPLHGAWIRASRVVADQTIFTNCGLFASAGIKRTRRYGHGIAIEMASNVSCNRADVSRSGRNGLQCSTAATCAGRGVIAHDCGRYGIRDTQNGRGDYRGSDVRRNGSHGIFSSFGSTTSCGQSISVDNGAWDGPNRSDICAAVSSRLSAEAVTVGGSSAQHIQIQRASEIGAHFAKHHSGGNITYGARKRPVRPNTLTSDGIIYA